MRVSLITAFYKDIVALNLIIEALKRQEYDDFEFIIAEDNCAPETADYLDSITGIDIIHTTQEDLGIRKAQSMNNGIINSTGEYLIFIDGDCIPHSNFIAAHAELAEAGTVLAGRRVNLGKRFSKLLRKHKLGFHILEKFFPAFYPLLLIDGGTHLEQGFSFRPQGWFYRNLIAKRRKKEVNLLGCNFSCYRSDMLAIDGFDECYGHTAVADDTDLQWRFKAYGLNLKSCKMAANVFHLHHGARLCRDVDSNAELLKMNHRKHQNNYHAKKGIDSHNT